MIFLLYRKYLVTLIYESALVKQKRPAKDAHFADRKQLQVTLLWRGEPLERDFFKNNEKNSRFNCGIVIKSKVL